MNKTILREILPGHFLSWFLSPVNRQIRISTLKCDPGKLNVNLSFSVQRISYANVISSSKLEPTIQGKVIVQFFFHSEALLIALSRNKEAHIIYANIYHDKTTNYLYYQGTVTANLGKLSYSVDSFHELDSVIYRDSLTIVDRNERLLKP